MSQILRQSTEVVVVIGPFVDVTDGFTPETGVTLTGADEAELLKASTNATVAITSNAFAAITGCDGWYALTLTTTDTNIVGPLTVMVNDDSVCLPVFARFQVIEEAAYDAIYAASAAPATSAEVAAASSNALVASSNAVVANTTAGAASSNALVANSNVLVVDTVVDAILVDTGTTLDGKLDVIDDFLDTEIAAILVDTGTTLQAELDGIQADTEDIQARLPAALISGRMDSTISAINDVTEAASRIARSTQRIVLGTVGSSSTTSNIVSSSLSPAAGATNQFQGRIVTFQQGTTTANLRGQSTDITASTADGQLVVTPLTTAPVSGDVFVIT